MFPGYEESKEWAKTGSNGKGAKSKRQRRGGDVTQRSTGHKQEPKVKDRTRKATQGPGKEDQVSQAGAEKLEFQDC